MFTLAYFLPIQDPKEPINILLIDDKPFFCFGKFSQDVELTEKYESYFKLYWIQTPAEARWVLDAYDELRIKSPRTLLELGLPPEILIFDYALSEPIPKQKKPEQISNITTNIRKTKLVSTPDYLHTQHPICDEVGRDKMGCFIGSLFARVFSASYPCGAIPTTAHPDKNDHLEKTNSASNDFGYATFFEWLNQTYLDDAFANKTRTPPTMEELINDGIKAFRKRVIELVSSNLISIPLSQIYELLNDPLKAKSSFITIHSNLGYRELPVYGVFIDVILNKPGDVVYIKSAERWAIKLLKGIFKNHKISVVRQAKEIADEYFNAFLSESHKTRYLLSQSLADYFIDPDNMVLSKEVGDICKKNGISEDGLIYIKMAKGKVPASKYQLAELPLWHHKSKDPYVVRFSALMLMVKSEQYCKDEKCTAIEDRRQVILKSLDPVPSNLLTYLDKGTNYKKDETTIIQALAMRKSDEKDTDGSKNIKIDHGLSINSVLEGKIEKGLKQGEGYLLRLYAEEIGFNEIDWPLWLKQAL